MTRAWMVAWCLSVTGCAESVGVTRAPTVDAAVIDAAVGADAPATRDATAARDVPSTRDAARARDAGPPPDRPSPTEPFALRLSNGSACPDWIFGDDTVYDDGRVWRVGGGGLLGWMYDDVTALPGGAEGALRLRRDVEATGVLAVPEGTYRGPADACVDRTLEYRRGDRVFTWRVSASPTEAATAPPAALDAALDAIDSALTIPP